MIACALVATWWTGPSQRCLFSSVSIHDINYQRWMNSVVHSGSKDHVLGYVRSLSHCRAGLDPGTRYRMRDLAEESGEYLSALCGIRSLALFNISLEHSDREAFRTCFSTFRGTLTSLSLGNFATSFSAFAALVDYLPSITELELDPLVLKPDETPVSLLSRPLRGKILVHEVNTDDLEFFNRFAALDLEYEELVIDSPFLYMGSKFLESALQISPGTVKFLKVTSEIDCG